MPDLKKKLTKSKYHNHKKKMSQLLLFIFYIIPKIFSLKLGCQE